ncbi:MAG: hypothetical protein NTZ46_04955 [Verrucomicrobia bacterium]|nr:hypothetical protein [Verrucomicrobiota bacterium]
MRSHSFYRLVFILLASGILRAQAIDEPPPREIQLVEKKAEQLTAKDASPLGLKAMTFAPSKWKHAETDHFIVHYRRVTEAQRVVREIEYTLWFVAQSLGATKERYAKKSHVYVFQDQKEWKDFLSQTPNPSWFASFAHGDNLFLHIGGVGERFDSETLAHETTHAVVARLYPGHRWPIWLNEGFAEYMSTASLAARKKVWTQGMQRGLSEASLPLAELVATTEYPASSANAGESGHKAVHRFYQSSQKLVRLLMNNFPKDRFPRFIDVILAGANFENAIVQVYGDQVKNYADFAKQYERFVK